MKVPYLIAGRHRDGRVLAAWRLGGRRIVHPTALCTTPAWTDSYRLESGL